MRLFRSRLGKIIASYLAINLLGQIFMPMAALALTDGPKSPEFSSFTPVATTDMVNLFSGDLNYNLPVIQVPGSDGGGYSLGLSYASGNSPDAEASWVGYGWTLNPGAITRSLKGYPDDYKNQNITKYNKMKTNWTFSTTAHVGVSAYSVNTSASKTITYNSYRGVRQSIGVGLSIANEVGVNLEITEDGATFKPYINVSKILADGARAAGLMMKDEKSSMSETKPKSSDETNYKKYASMGFDYGKTVYDMVTYEGSVPNAFVSPTKSGSIAISYSNIVTPGPVPVGVQAGLRGHFSYSSNNPSTTFEANGYFNNPNNASHSDSTRKVLSDFGLERETQYERSSRFISLPLKNADHFNVSGENVGGSFKYYPESAGHYYDNFKENDDIGSYDFGLKTLVGADLGIGFNISAGFSSSELEHWTKPGNTHNGAVQFEQDEDPIDRGQFRFSHDMGGAVSYDGDDGRIIKAELSRKGTQYIWDPTPSINFPTEGTAEDIATSDKFLYNSTFTNKKSSSDIVPSFNGNTLEGFSIVNSQGSTVNYDEPVFNKNEANYSFSISARDKEDYVVYGNDLFIDGDNKLDLSSQNNKTVIGEHKGKEYANTFLVTEILTPNYVDMGASGVDEADYGGWTKFDYFTKYGEGASNYYRWRHPYRGAYYNRNDRTNTKDDVASVSTGHKEIKYLKTVETETHIAFFVTNQTSTGDDERFKGYIGMGARKYPASYLTGTGTPRADGLGVDDASKTDPASTSGYKCEECQLEKLEKIVLFSKTRTDKPIKTVHLEYGNQIFPGAENSIDAKGKLTLEKVWFEYEGISDARIAPYEFAYEYDVTLPGIESEDLTSPELLRHHQQFNGVEKPKYEHESIGAWGTAQFKGKELKDIRNPWTYQGAIGTRAEDKDGNTVHKGEKYDPAAWYLKSIKLPSGGKILMQYEQKDYAHVQNREVMAMAKIKSSNGGENGKRNEFVVDLDGLGINLNEFDNDNSAMLAAARNYANRLKVFYGVDGDDKEKKRILFKMLYNWTKEDTEAPDLNSCQSRYFRGYAPVTKVSLVESGGIATGIKITLDAKQIPKRACTDFSKNVKRGAANSDECECKVGSYFSVDDFKIGKVFAMKIYDKMGEFYNDFFDEIKKDKFKEEDYCLVVNDELSYLRLPMHKNKRGGGARVKRLLMYDNGLEASNNGAVLYGTEYIYNDENGKSYGVVSNEPSSQRDENPFVEYIKKGDDDVTKLIAGESLAEVEGPIGEALFPGASIGYSKVITKNIHTGKSTNGFNVNEYYTHKDFPTDGSYGRNVSESEKGNYEAIDQKGIAYSNLKNNNAEKGFATPPNPFFTFKTSSFYATQGYRFIQNSMSGKLKTEQKYGGSLDGDNYLTYYKKEEYFQPGEKIKMASVNASGNVIVENKLPGKEMDVALYTKSVHDASTSVNIGVELSIGAIFWPPVWPVFGFNVNINSSDLNLHSASKIVSYPAIKKSTTVYQDGVYSINENVAFNDHTGSPILTKSYDSYNGVVNGSATKAHNGAIYNYTVPGSWYYEGMGQKSTSTESVEKQNLLQLNVGSYVGYGLDNMDSNIGIANWMNDPDNLLNASASVFEQGADNPDWYDNSTPSNVTNELNSKYRLKSMYALNTNISQGKSQDAGVISLSKPFDWTDLSSINGTEWVKTNEVTKYSYDGKPQEEVDVLNIYSAAKFAHNDHVPSVIGSNVSFDELYFESYEESGDVSGIAHSGNYSNSVGTNELLLTVPTSNHLKDDGGLFYFWLKTYNEEDIPVGVKVKINSVQYDLNVVAQTGEWRLVKTEVPAQAFVAGPVSLGINYVGANGGYVDDLKFQPKDAQSTCYVYDPTTFRLLTQFDDSHFGLYYQYNDEGQLIRKLIETEEGIKTVHESFKNTPLKPRK